MEKRFNEIPTMPLLYLNRLRVNKWYVIILIYIYKNDIVGWTVCVWHSIGPFNRLGHKSINLIDLVHSPKGQNTELQIWQIGME